MPIVELPDGTELEFPDDMSQQEIKAIMQKKFGAPAPQQEQPQIPPNIAPGTEPGGMPDEFTVQQNSIPRQMLKGILGQLPFAGTMIGSAIGAGAGAVGGLGVGALPAGAAGGALGGGVGSAVQGLGEYLMGEPITPEENVKNIAQETYLGAVVPPAFEKAIKPALKLVTAPFAGRLARRMAENPTAKAAQELVEQEGAPISPSVITGKGSWLETLAGSIWPGKSIMQKQRERLPEITKKLVDEFAESRNLYGTNPIMVDTAWENWVQAAGGKEAKHTLPETLKVLAKEVERPYAQSKKEFWKTTVPTLLDDLAGAEGATTVQGIRDFLQKINITSVKGAEQTGRRAIIDALKKDMEKLGGGEVSDMLTEAMSMGRLEKISAPLKNIIEKAMIKPRTAGEDRMFSPGLFASLWDSERKKLVWKAHKAKISGIDDWTDADIKTVDKFAEKMKALAYDYQKMAQHNAPMSATDFGKATYNSPLSAAAAMYTQPFIAVPGVLFDRWLSGSLLKPNGLMRRFLTSGFKPPELTAKSLMFKGGKLAMPKGEEND